MSPIIGIVPPCTQCGAPCEARTLEIREELRERVGGDGYTWDRFRPAGSATLCSPRCAVLWVESKHKGTVDLRGLRKPGDA